MIAYLCRQYGELHIFNETYKSSVITRLFENTLDTVYKGKETEINTVAIRLCSRSEFTLDLVNVNSDLFESFGEIRINYDKNCELQDVQVNPRKMYQPTYYEKVGVKILDDYIIMLLRFNVSYILLFKRKGGFCG